MYSKISLGNNFKRDISVVPVSTVHTEVQDISISDKCCLSLDACCLLL
jgi:hypothetical protein